MNVPQAVVDAARHRYFEPAESDTARAAPSAARRNYYQLDAIAGARYSPDQTTGSTSYLNRLLKPAAVSSGTAGDLGITTQNITITPVTGALGLAGGQPVVLANGTAQVMNVITGALSLVGQPVTVTTLDVATNLFRVPAQFMPIGSGNVLTAFVAPDSTILFAALENRERENAALLIDDIDCEAARTPRWGSLSRRLTAIVDAAESEADYAPVSLGSLNSLLELIRKAPNLTRPAIALTRGGNLWLEWVLAPRERISLELLPGSLVRYAWVRPDVDHPHQFARRHGTFSINEFALVELGSLPFGI